MSDTISDPPNAGSTISPLKSGRSIQEFWIDFLLEEEFRVDPNFARLFLAEAYPENKILDVRVREVIHSMTDKFGEADLVVLFERTQEGCEGAQIALLIEDKITASFQPLQADRYRRRGEDGKKTGLWREYRTVLVAPEKYLPGDQTHGFDAKLPLEQIKHWLCPSDEARHRYKCARIDEAIAKKNISGVQIVDPAMTAFRATYYAYLQDFNARRKTNFVGRLPRPTYWGDYWFKLKSADLPLWSRLRHRAPTGDVSIDFYAVDIKNVAGLREVLDQDMRLLATGKYLQHTSIRLGIPKIASFESFEDSRNTVEAALQAAERLWSLYKRENEFFDRTLALGRGSPA